MFEKSRFIIVSNLTGYEVAETPTIARAVELVNDAGYMQTPTGETILKWYVKNKVTNKVVYGFRIQYS